MPSIRVSTIMRSTHRLLPPEDADKLEYRDPVRVLDRATGDVLTGTVVGWNPPYVRVRIDGSGAELAFDVDDPVFWSETRRGPRRSPRTEDANHFLVTTA